VSCTLSGTPTATGSYAFTLRATDFSGCTAARAYTVIIGALPAPAGFQATTITASSINLTWSAVSGAASYNIYRGSSSGPLALFTNTVNTAYLDNSVSASEGYVYGVRAVTGSGESGSSNLDTATTVIFNEAVAAGVTTIKFNHLIELRNAVTRLRTLANAPPISFTDPLVASVIKRLHIIELRDSINLVRAHFGMPPLSYTDVVITAGTTKMKAAHINELRTASH
jgi:hypothetical protein